MSELKLISPLLDGLELVHTIQSRGGTNVYLLRNPLTGLEYVLKLISIPESQTQVDALLITGAASDEAEAQKYYEQVVQDYQDELAALEPLRDSTNVATYLRHQVCPKDEGTGFEIYLLSEKWTTLVSYLSENAMTHLRALNLGLDLCSALCELRAKGLIHRNVKPENIYLNGLNGFMLGDLGIARIDRLKYCAMPEHMVTEYTAPELSDILNPFNTTVDIYSVGMVLYRILNGNHGPFEDEKTTPKAANKLRLSGEPLPAPLYSDYELTAVILKACAYEPTDRYQTPEEFMQDLVLYMKRNTVTDSLIVPPIITDPDCMVPPESMDEEIEPVSFTDVSKLDSDFVENFSPDTQGLNAIIESVKAKESEEESRQAAAPPAQETPEQQPAGPPPGQAPSGPEPPSEAEDGIAPEPSPEEETPGEPDPDIPAAPPPPVFAAQRTGFADEEEPSGASEFPTAEAVKKVSKKRPKIWIPIVIAVVLLGAIAVSVYFLVFGGPPLRILGIDPVDKGSDFVTVSVQCEKPDADLTVLCTDAYGNVLKQPYTGEDNTFSDLSAGTQYTISVESNTSKKLTGTTYTMVTTTASTEIVSFTATSPAVGEAELNLIVSGPDPGEWTVRYYADGVEEKTVKFSGHTASVTGLEPNVKYTFELEQPEGTALSGQSSIQFTSAPSVTISDLKAAELTESTVKVTWSSDNDPGEWSVTCTAAGGTAQTQTVSDREAEFTELAAGETYTITVTSAGTETPASITVVPSATTVSSVKADAEDSETVNVSWASETGASGWQVVYTAKGSSLTAKQSSTQNQATLTGLIPGTTYEIEIRSATGEKLSGSPAAEVTTPAAGKFGAHGATRFFLGMFSCPSKANWTYRDLGDGGTAYKASGKIAFAIQTLTGLTSSDDKITVTCVVKDQNGAPVECFSSESVWDDMWDNELYVGTLQTTPAAVGSYQLIVYFNGQLVTTKNFTIS